jgi:fibronectin type 3 domain-containing protein
LRAAVVSGKQIDLQWDNNANNSTGTQIERRDNSTGAFAPIATVKPDATTYSDTTVASAGNCAYRVTAFNSYGISRYTYAWVYSGWTESILGKPAGRPLYHYYQYSNLDFIPSAPPDHVAVNDDSTHGKNLILNTMVGTGGNAGSYYIYFFYQDQNNWYRLNVAQNSSKFEKCLDGAISQIGASGRGASLSCLQLWQVVVTDTGTLQFYAKGSQYLDVSDRLSFSSGKIGLGGYANAPVWQNVNFDITGNQPTGLSAVPGSGQVSLKWNPVKGATGYCIYRGVADGDMVGAPIATVTGANYMDSTVIGGDNITYFYQVAAVSASGTSAFSNEAAAFPAGAGTPNPPSGLVARGRIDQVSLSWNPSKGAASYSVFRGNSPGAEGSDPIADHVISPSITDSNAVGGNTYYYKVTASNAHGTSFSSNEASAKAISSGSSNGPAFINPSFETPQAGGFSYNPAGSGWTFTNNAGIQQNGSGYSGNLPLAPDGVQTALLQGVVATLGTMSQSVKFPAGAYTITFFCAQRYGQAQPILVTVDGTAVGTYTPASNNYARITTAPFTVTSGTHTITFAATDKSADKTSFIDLVTINSVGDSSKGVGAHRLARDSQ